MARQHINIGTPNGNNGDFVRDSFDKVNDNFIELYDSKLEGIVEGNNINIDNTNPLTPIISVDLSSIDGSETKLSEGTNISITGLGTILNPYVISNDLNQVAIIDDLNSTSTTEALSANQGKILNDTKASKLSELSDVNSSVDTPSEGDILVYRSASNEFVLETKPVSSGTPAWGDLTGTLSNQVDLQNTLNGKANTTHSHLASDITDFDTEVTNNPAVQSNSAKISNATHSGDVVGSTNLTISNNVVNNSKLANMSANTIKGRLTTTGDPQDLSAAQVRSLTSTESTAELNVRDTNNRNRSNHTGTQSISTITNLQSSLDSKANSTHTHSASDIVSGILNINRIPTGTSSTTVSIGNHNHSGVYEPTFTKNSAFNKNFGGTGTGTTVSRSDHSHSNYVVKDTEMIQDGITSDIEVGMRRFANGFTWTNSLGVSSTGLGQWRLYKNSSLNTVDFDGSDLEINGNIVWREGNLNPNNFLSSISNDSTTGQLTAAAFITGNWTIDQDGSGNLEFRYNGTPVFQMKTNGDLEATDFKQGLT